MHTKLPFPIHVITAAAVMMLFSTCHKPDVIPDCGAPFCQIQAVTGYDGISTTPSVSSSFFDYNTSGNPIRRIRSESGTGYENERYRYDPQNRLTDQILYDTRDEGNHGDFFWEWHRFKYNSKGMIYLDSVYMVGIIDDHPLPHPFVLPQYYLIFFEYDIKGRIIREKVFFTDGQPWYVNDYTYDSQQNLTKRVTTGLRYPETSGTAYYGPYDNKINFLRTSKVWQFLNRNYSANNIVPVASYNIYGLPTKIRPGAKGHLTPFLDVTFADLDITYKCK